MPKKNGHVKVHMPDGTVHQARLERGSSSNLEDFILIYEDELVESEEELKRNLEI